MGVIQYCSTNEHIIAVDPGGGSFGKLEAQNQRPAERERNYTGCSRRASGWIYAMPLLNPPKRRSDRSPRPKLL